MICPVSSLMCALVHRKGRCLSRGPFQPANCPAAACGCLTRLHIMRHSSCHGPHIAMQWNPGPFSQCSDGHRADQSVGHAEGGLPTVTLYAHLPSCTVVPSTRNIEKLPLPVWGRMYTTTSIGHIHHDAAFLEPNLGTRLSLRESRSGAVVDETGTAAAVAPRAWHTGAGGPGPRLTV